MLRERGLSTPAAIAATTREWVERGAGVLHVLQDGQVIGALALEDRIRPESRAAVAALQERGVKVALITGDARQVAQAVGADLGIDEVFAEVLPQDKDSKVAELQSRGMTVAMVGDGVNDAPALARAEVGIAIGAGTDVAMESAAVVLAGNDPRAVLSMIDLSRAGYRKMVQNLVWATGYNVLAVPLAAGVLAPAGIVLSPAVGAVLMSVSTIVVALNAQLLRRLDLDPARLAALATEDRPDTERSAERTTASAAVPTTLTASRPDEGLPVQRSTTLTALALASALALAGCGSAGEDTAAPEASTAAATADASTASPSALARRPPCRAHRPGPPRSPPSTTTRT